MTIRERILLDLAEIGNSRLLYQVFEFVHLIKKNVKPEEGNIKEVLTFAGSLNDEDARQIQKDISEEFNRSTTKALNP
ncbi:MAG: hypothetical protein KDD06_11825 [Phaeodactylibacter sp.]|nr:hypothetical protein [Phaeodactylibacter sp.]MCB9289058.1 hypothetical protein [Lewinellaceae bacterium]